MKNDAIEKVFFSELNIRDTFFDSLRNDYSDFDDWFYKKVSNNEEAYVLRDKGKLLGFLYLKKETEKDESIQPLFHKGKRLKIGTFKIDSHGTVLGQRFLSIILRKMLDENFEFTYVTVFPKQVGLISLLEKFGFRYWGLKNNEHVYWKNKEVLNNIYADFPRINCLNGTKKHLLSIYPDFHTKLFPASRLNTERDHFVEDLSFTNTCEKIYLCAMRGVDEMKMGDLVVIYRTAERGKSAEYSSVVTSICTVVETTNINRFNSFDTFLAYCGKGTVFTKQQLMDFWNKKNYPIIVKLLYNAPLQKRIIRKKLIEDIGISRQKYIGYMELTNEQFYKIIELGEINESFIIN